MPPFLAEIVASVKKPIRTGNSISWFYASLPEANGEDSWWGYAAFNNSGNFGAPDFGNNYQFYPIPIEQSGVTWSGQTLQPYPNFAMNNNAPSGFNIILKTYIPLNAFSSLVPYFQSKFVNNGQPIVNTWMTKCPKFTTRFSAYYVINEPGNVVLAGGGNLQYMSIKAKSISSWEPIGYHAALLACANLINYYQPTQESYNTSLAAIFAATPNSTQQVAVTSAHVAAYPGQGTTAAIKAGTSNNPEEVVSHVGAEGVSGLLNDTSQEPPKHLQEKVTNKLQDICGSTPIKKAEAVIEKTSTFAQNVFKTVEAFA